MEGDRFHNVYRFPNGYGASVVSKPKSSDDQGFIILVIRFGTGRPDHEYEVDKSTPLTDDVILCEDWQTVEDVLGDIKGL